MPKKTTASSKLKAIVRPKVTVKRKPAKLTDADILDAFTQLSSALTSLSKQIADLRGDSEDDEGGDDEAVEDAPAKTTKAEKAPVKVTVAEIKARYELWGYDEYNQGSIVSAGPRLDKVLEAAKRYVTEQNVDNALAAGEKDKAWEAYFPQVFVDGEATNDVLYAGNKRDGKHYVFVKGTDKWELRRPDASVQFRFYLGQTNNGRVKNDWFLADHKGKIITSINDISLERKTVLFVKVV